MKRRYRSMLFVPGHNLDWMLKAPRFQPDALIFDLEDAVAIDRKPAARLATASAIDQMGRGPQDLWVRLNGWRTGEMLADLDAVARPGLTGVALAKCHAVADIHALDLVLSEYETSRGLPAGGVSIMPMAESAFGMQHLYEITTASPRCRVSAGVAGSAPGGDYYRALGSEWTEDGVETIYSRHRAVMISRAAGLEHIIAGPVTNVDDLDYVRRVMARSRMSGATGNMVIYPSHVAIANEVYSPSPEQIAEAREILVSMAEAVEKGEGAVRYKGGMIDYAMVRTSYDLLEQAKAFGLDVGEYPTVAVLSL